MKLFFRSEIKATYFKAECKLWKNALLLIRYVSIRPPESKDAYCLWSDKDVRKEERW